MGSITAPAQVAARLDALHATVAGLRELNHPALDPVSRCQTLQSLKTAQRLQTVLSHDIVHSLTFEDPAHIGGPVHQVVADWCRITPTEARRRVKDAAQLSPRVTLTGQQLPPELPATAQRGREGLLGTAHLRVIQTFVRDLPTDTPAPIAEHA